MFRRCEASGGPKGQKVFHHRIKSSHVFQFRVRFPAALQKSLGGDAMQRHYLKNIYRFSGFKMPDGILRREPEQGF